MFNRTFTHILQDGKRYYQVKWRDSWEPEERLMAACESALQAFWKEYYANVEKEIRKQVVSASQTINMSPAKDVTVSIPTPQPLQVTEEEVQLPPPSQTVSVDVASVQVTIAPNVVESFPEQSSTVAYYAVQDNENNTDHSAEIDATKNANQSEEINAQAEILTQIINAAPGITATKWTDEEKAGANRRTLTTITADTLNTKNVAGPDSNSKFHCDICLKSFVSKRNVQRHMLSHTGEKPWMCEFCFKRFRQKPHLEQHVNIHKGIKNAVCSVCGKAFNHRSNLVTHMATHSNVRPHTCEVCGENFKLKHTLAKHMMVHTKQDVDKRHQCKVCKRSFRDKSYLAEHETIHNKEKPWQCDICMKSFSFKRRYQMHLEVHQSKDGGDEFVCHFCPKKFKSKIYLQKHLERHENKRKKKKKKKRGKDGEGNNGEGGEDVGDNESAGDNTLDDDVDISMSEVDVKAEGELEEGETIDLHHGGDNDMSQQPQIIQIEGTDEADQNMVVASMLPMTSLNMDDQATYVALAQLTQAAIESAPMDESGNVILMSYEDIQQSMQEIQAAQQEQDDQQDIGLHDIQIAQQHHQPATGLVPEQHMTQQPNNEGEFAQMDQHPVISEPDLNIQQSNLSVEN